MLGEWEIPSNSGYCALSFIGITCDGVAIDHCISYECSRLDGQGLRVMYIDWRIHSVKLTMDACNKLVKALGDWLETSEPFSIALSLPAAWPLVIRVGSCADVARSKDKPECQVHYGYGSSDELRCAFVVDQTCLRIAHNRLSLMLTRLDGLDV